MKQPQELLRITTNPVDGTIWYTIKPTRINTKTKLGNYGIKIGITSSITGNCQIGAAHAGYNFAALTIPEVKEFLDKAMADGPLNRTANITPFYKSTLLIDVHKQYVDKIERRMKRFGAFRRLKSKYKNRTGSSMTMMLWDLRGPRADFNEA